MLRIGAKLFRAATIGGSLFGSSQLPPPRFFSVNNNNVNTSSFKTNPVALQMINYALSLARSQKSDESYAQAQLVLEQCHSAQLDESAKGLVLIAMSTLFSERGNFGEAIEKLQKVQDLGLSSLAVKVAASEALAGLYLESHQDDHSSATAEICLQLLETIRLEIGGGGSEFLEARAKALKGLVELVRGNVESAQTFFEGAQGDKGCFGNVALSYGEFLHCKRDFQTARELYQKAMQDVSESKDFTDSQSLSACNMNLEESLLGATCSLGQLEAHLGNFDDAEEILTAALKKAEEGFGNYHPKVGIILTCIALMYRHKAAMERSSSLLIQEGLYRRAIEVLKAPPLEIEGVEAKLSRRDILALARGGYAETLIVQQNRKAEGEKMKQWAEKAWTNRRLSLAEALEPSESSTKVAVIDTRISRVL
ncbi:uncharacterized protein LOC107791194 isoform X1 [Nicotiana tabacum]|uniref:Uncharacterized protein LOC107791194 isoform X1 n=2 Tax=Nicotiana TaxID=4085 RepID=A0A1S3ZWE5_TOBAC|nr:PREDICTED: uncharacterized protein LOC104231264 [Nicotiana sylvestris]XP_016468697.1 PREDICTED: uncharacterized protein LOC107791194 isoform X1 [Nicotiana tabacum]